MLCVSIREKGDKGGWWGGGIREDEGERVLGEGRGRGGDEGGWGGNMVRV